MSNDSCCEPSMNMPRVVIRADLIDDFMWVEDGYGVKVATFSIHDDWDSSFPTSQRLWDSLAEWAGEYSRRFDAPVETDLPLADCWDWDAFDDEGMRLATLLKTEVERAYRVIYRDPADSPWNSRRREIFDDGGFSELPIDHPWIEAEPYRFVRRIVADEGTAISRSALGFAAVHGYSSGGWTSQAGSTWSITTDSLLRPLELNISESDGVACFSMDASTARESEVEAIATKVGKAFIHITLNDLQLDDALSRFNDWIQKKKIRTLFLMSSLEDDSEEFSLAVYGFLKEVHERFDCAFRSLIEPRALEHYRSLNFFLHDGRQDSAGGFHSVRLGTYPLSAANGLTLSGAIVTAGNPFLSTASQGRNQAAALALRSWLDSKSLLYDPIVEGELESDLELETQERRPLSSEWLFVWGMTTDLIREYCVEFRQYAGFLVSSNDPTYLVIHPDLKI